MVRGKSRMSKPSHRKCAHWWITIEVPDYPTVTNSESDEQRLESNREEYTVARYNESWERCIQRLAHDRVQHAVVPNSVNDE
ncbi:hypothetical protein CEXT_205591 [Caerostris extrusa]|uniref:Uncharacterized protein n=1 Tax=Caerostris extrusa TaxID=172846 RepID=A0AAV4Y3X6_CAEEX|nr:hypothetical protein CEXT_205591 [Caerostris extrusa]